MKEIELVNLSSISGSRILVKDILLGIACGACFELIKELALYTEKKIEGRNKDRFYFNSSWSFSFPFSESAYKRN